jgi:hypothetical protein
MRTLLIRAAVAACSLCLLVPLFYRADFLGDRVNERNYRRVEVGMTERQVEAILGGGQEAHYRWISPCGLPDESSRDRYPPCRPEKSGDSRDGSHLPVEWYGDMYSVVVWFDEGGRVSGKGSWEWVPTKGWEIRSWVERVYRFLRLENGPPRTAEGEAMYNGRPVRERCRPLAVTALLAAVAAWTLRRHRPNMRKE